MNEAYSKGRYMSDYQTFLDAKTHAGAKHGFEPNFMLPQLFDFQQDLVTWAIRKGRAALFVDTGLGKTPMQLTWAQNVANHTQKPVLILAPLAVSSQTVREGEKFGIEVHRTSEGETPGQINVTNYERLHYFNPDDFGGIVLDESSILKSYDGATKTALTRFMTKIPYRLLATATAAPNDYIELGTSSEALGYLGHMDMLNRFFRNERANSATRRMYGEAPKWTFKGHAEEPFWKWVTSWARAVRKPSDLGYDDARLILPPLHENQRLIEVDRPPDEMLFTIPAATLAEQRRERNRTITERCEAVAELVDHDKPALIWCHTNAESKLLTDLIPDAVEVAGAHNDDQKEDRLIGFADGKYRALVTKPSIGAWGLNFQHCAHVTYFPSHSYEQYYQAIRRCWRFGQENPVTVDVVLTEGEKKIMANLQRKAKQADEMFDNLVREMHDSITIGKRAPFTEKEQVPAWL